MTRSYVISAAVGTAMVIIAASTTGNFALGVTVPWPCEIHKTSNEIVVLADMVSINHGGTYFVNITKDGTMPQLTAAYCGPEVYLYTPNVNWFLQIGSEWGTYDNICNPTKMNFTSPGQTLIWDIEFGGTVVGGEARLHWDWWWNGTHRYGIETIRVMGTQPGKNDVIKLITSSTDIWYAQYIAQRESNFVQFTDSGYPLRYAGWHDNGYGIFQLTNPAPTCSQIWSWKENVLAGVKRIEEKRKEAETWMKRQRSQASEYNSTHVPKRFEGDCGQCVFEDGTNRTIEDAVGMKAYNGASHGMYCSWKNDTHEWVFNPFADNDHYYVWHVCSVIPKDKCND